MIKAIIIDDEIKAISTLKTMLGPYYPALTVIETAESVKAAIPLIEKYNPDLVFLDIEMPFENGFTLLEKVKPVTFDVIFTTAYDHYAIKAIKFSALDYLLKPIDLEDLKEAIARVALRKNNNPQQLPDFDLLFSNLKLKGNSAKIGVPTFEGLEMVDSRDIIKCSAHESYTIIKLSDGRKLMVSKNLKEYEELLTDLNFLRIHNSSIINLAQVKKYLKGDGGYVVMSDGESVEVSRRKKNELLIRLELVST